jgi:UDP-N-acetylmuramate dehydrogenase
MNIREHEPLRLHTTLRTGGPARYFAEADTEEVLREALAFARERALPVFVLGGGSNVLAGDEGFRGLVVRMATRGVRFADAAGPVVEVVAEAGESWDALVASTVERGLRGLENMSLIPGQVGAAVVGNIGAYGAEVQDTLLWAEALDRRTGQVRRWAAAECAFGYRTSFFKTPAGRQWLVLRAAFGLRPDGAPHVAYRDLQDYFAARGVSAPSLAEVRAAVIAVRRRKLPDVTTVGTAGSFFKNPVISRGQYEALAARYPNLPGHDEGPGKVKVPLGWILDHICGLKGARCGRVGTHATQALVIVNDGGTAAEVEQFARKLAGAVKAQTGLDVEWEVERVPG